MRKLCPNLDREDGLDTVLEVPIPEEMFISNISNTNGRPWKCLKTWMQSHPDKSSTPSSYLTSLQNTELQLLLGVIGAPLIPLPILSDHSINPNIKDRPIEASMAKYIVQQYIAATGGEKVLNSINSMYAMGKVTMSASDFQTGDGKNSNKSKVGKVKRSQEGEVGGFVLWQKRSDLWSLELVVSGCKINAGSDRKVA